MKSIVGRWGRLDVVVHNAIYMPLITFEATTPEEWSRQIDVGIGGLFNCTHAAWNQMKAQGGGHVIGIASGSSIRGYKEEIAYCTIKHGVEGFVKALSLEARAHNIALNTIGPGVRIKPTRLTWAEYDQAPADLRAGWADPVELGRAWVWLAAQPPGRFSGYRFDAAKIAQTIAHEGSDFATKGPGLRWRSRCSAGARWRRSNASKDPNNSRPIWARPSSATRPTSRVD